MADKIHEATKKVSYNRWSFLLPTTALVLMVGLALVINSCAPAVIGPDGTKMTRAQLDQAAEDKTEELNKRKIELLAEIEKLGAEDAAFKRKLQVAYSAIEREEEFYAGLIQFAETVGGQVAAGTFNPASLIAPGLGLMGLGYGLGKRVDKKRADAKVLKLKAELAAKAA